MNISSRDTSCYTNLSPDSYNLSLQMYSDQDQASNNNNNNNNNIISSTVANSLLYSLSILKEKVHQLQTLMSIILSPSSANHTSSSSSSSAPPPSIHNAIQDIIMTASSMLITFQHQTGLNIAVAPNPGTFSITHNNNTINTTSNGVVSPKSILGQALTRQDHHDHDQTALIDWSFSDHDNNFNPTTSTTTPTLIYNKFCPKSSGDNSNDEIVELGAADLLAKYTHYCQVCGKGFKRDANLRMHMRAHGDEYKTSAALTKPMKINNNNALDEYSATMRDKSKKYSCPQDGCRWNQRHARFQPLKSMICAKNHYKRSHCPKMYVCKRCNRKQFSVLSDLRTHEKHCGDPKWQCSCGTTFSRKDKLMGHVSLFHGHTPILLNNINNNNNSSPRSTRKSNNIVNNNKLESQVLSQVHIDNMVKSMISE